MRVVVNNHVYEMPKDKSEKFLKIASRGVPVGIYSVKKSGVILLTNEPCSDDEELKRKTAKYAMKGFKVYANRNDERNE